jgi:uncharacterized membrane protein HdeD (DUF308 family)
LVLSYVESIYEPREEFTMNGTSFLLIRGIVGIVAGLIAFLWPGVTIVFLVALFGFYAFFDGVANLIVGLKRTPERGRSGAAILQGIVGIACGVVAFLWPNVTALALVLLIGAWAIVTGVLEIAAAIRLRREIRGEWLLALAGTLSIAFGLLLFFFPAPGAIGIAWALGAYAAASGAVLVALAIRLRTRAVVTA